MNGWQAFAALVGAVAGALLLTVVTFFAVLEREFRRYDPDVEYVPRHKAAS